MDGSLMTYLIGIAGIVGLMTAWIIVQTLWRKVFREHLSDDDVLADRRSCGNCGCTTVCTRKDIQTNNIDK